MRLIIRVESEFSVRGRSGEVHVESFHGLNLNEIKSRSVQGQCQKSNPSGVARNSGIRTKYTERSLP